jgi:PAS domain S-box-containing protein
MPDCAKLMQQQQVLADFGEFALRSQDLDQILAEATRLVGDALETGRSKILEIQHQEKSLLVRAGVGWEPGIVGHLRLSLEEHSSETFAIEAAAPVVSQDIGREERFEVPPFMRDAGVVALVNVPIFLPGGRPYGLLQVDDTRPRDFGEDEVQFLRTYASILGPVIDRLLMAQTLRSTEERFRLTVEAALDYAIFLTDPEDRITDWLPGAQAVFGWTAAEALGQPAAIIFTPEDRERHQDRWETATACREGVAPNIRWHLRKDGRRVFIEGSTRALRDPNGTLLGFLKIGQDVTERRAAEEELRRIEAALREQEAQQRALVEGLPQLIWRSDEGGFWSWASPQWRDYTGQSGERSRGWGWLDALHPEDRMAAREAWHRAGPAGLLQFDGRIRHAASGRYAWFQTRGLPVRGDDGRAAEWIGSCTDIDEQMRAREVLARTGEELEARIAERTAALMATEESLRQAQKMEAVGQLTGGLAHDFNNMLQGILGSLELAQYQLTAGRSDKATAYLEAIHDSADRAAGLTRRLLAFARRRRLEPRPVDADGLVAGLADLIRRTVGPGITLQLRLQDGAGSVLCDPNELESALLNLCINARDAMPVGGRLAIGTETVRLSPADIQPGEAAPGHYVAVSVVDSGTGMPPEVLERVFEPFFTTKPQGQGTGLGLSQVWGFVRQSGGLVRIESTPGQGTTVRLLLPLHEKAAAGEAPRSRPSSLANTRGTVLLVDDEDAVRGPAADKLRALGLEVLGARDGPEALKILASARPDLLVTDVGLPNGMNGRQVAEAVREHIPGLPVLFITGYAATALPPGMEVIDKPFGLEVLAQRVLAILKGRQ